MIKLLEDQVQLKVREEEVDLVKGMLSDCETKFSEIMMQETTREYTTTLTVLEDKFLKLVISR